MNKILSCDLPTDSQKPTLRGHVALALATTRLEREIAEVAETVGQFMPKKQSAPVWQAYRKIGDLKSNLEEMMFADFPKLGDAWTGLYFGTPEDVQELISELEGASK